MSQADRDSTRSPDVIVTGFVALTPRTGSAQRTLGASMMLVPAADGAELIRQLEAAGLTVRHEGRRRPRSRAGARTRGAEP